MFLNQTMLSFGDLWRCQIDAEGLLRNLGGP
jgi:hypothetical protein